VPDPLRQRIADERAKLEVEFAEQKQAYEEKKRVLDEFERVILGSKNGDSAEPDAEEDSALTLSQAVRFVLRDGRAKTNAEATGLVQAMSGVKLPKSKLLSKSVSLSLYTMKKRGEVEFDETTRKYRLIR
jgi:hypothetical protein